ISLCFLSLFILLLDSSCTLVLRDKVLSINLTSDVFNMNGTLHINASDPPCLPTPSDWPICSGKQPKFLTLPNFFNHTSVEEVGAFLKEWAWLTRVGCHHGTEWFLCLLLAPGCPSPLAPLRLPCRSFCHVLRDSCWASLENGRLPVECRLLPERAISAFPHTASVQLANNPSATLVTSYSCMPVMHFCPRLFPCHHISRFLISCCGILCGFRGEWCVSILEGKQLGHLWLGGRAKDGIYDIDRGWENGPLRRKSVAIVRSVWEKGQRCRSR
uniref:FZ domain-containing protein n=1 Tax=Seriola dumerili TaxID=41447 RepID=A0A3B4UH65_SERDU